MSIFIKLKDISATIFDIHPYYSVCVCILIYCNLKCYENAFLKYISHTCQNTTCASHEAFLPNLKTKFTKKNKSYI